MSIESVMPSNHLVLCCPLLLLPSIFLSIRVFSNELALRVRRPKYQSFSFNISPSNEHSGLSSFRIDWFDLLDVQGTLKSLLQHHSSKSSIIWCSAFFMVHLSRDYWSFSLGKWKVRKMVRVEWQCECTYCHWMVQLNMAQIAYFILVIVTTIKIF